MVRKHKSFSAHKHRSQERTNVPTPQTEALLPEEIRDAESYKPNVRHREGPVLAWDRELDLERVASDAYPLYIHEKIHPEAWIKRLSGSVTNEFQTDLFADLNGFPKEASYQWFQHTGNWQNRIIRGDSISVMASLAKKEGMNSENKGVQMFFFDPPFGIKFNSNFQTKSTSRAVTDGKSSFPSEPGATKVFRDTYKNGIHSYLDTIYRIAVYARELLRESGSFFMQIGDANVNRCAVVLDEIFGFENRVAMIPFRKTGATASKHLPLTGDYLLWYSNNKEELKFNQLYEKLQSRKDVIRHFSSYVMIEEENGNCRPLTKEEKRDPDSKTLKGRIFGTYSLSSQGQGEGERFEPFRWNGKDWKIPTNSHWSVSRTGLEELNRQHRIVAAPSGKTIRWKWYEDEVPGRKINNYWSKVRSANDLHYVVETAESVIERCILMSTDPGDLVMDITCGSGTTAFVAEKWGRRWITCDSSPVPIQLARQRLLTATFDWFQLKETSSVDPSCGFEYESVPRVSAGILAYNQKRDPIQLVNQPKKVRGKKRCAGPFTVESISPHQFVPLSNVAWREESRRSVSAVIAALEKSGIKIGNKRIHFESIEPGPPGTLVTHTARLVREDDSKSYAGLVILSDDQIASNELISRAAIQAGRFRELTDLVVIAFGFTADVRSKDSWTLGRLNILKAQANRDLTINQLAHQASDDSIVAIGEPDIEIFSVGNDQFCVEVLGWDTYDPATGNVRRGVPNSIDTWMIDTNFNDRAFIANRIHFPGKEKDRQIKRLKTRIANSLNQEEWKAVLSLKSLRCVLLLRQVLR